MARWKCYIMPFLFKQKLRKKNFILNALLLAVFSGLSLAGILRHEIWLDEAQHFLIARDSSSLAQMIHACRNEGHPLLWNLLLFVITRFTADPFYMQMAHLLIACATAAIVLGFEGHLAEKALIIFGYFFFYEYNLISRNYGISALLILLPVWLYLRNRLTPVRLAVLLFLLAQTHLFSLLFSVAFVAAVMLTDRNFFAKLGKRQTIISLALILTGWAVSALSIIPPLQYGNAFLAYDGSAYFSGERILKTLSVCLKGIFYVPDYLAPGHRFINTFIFTSLNLNGWLMGLLSAAAMALPAWILKKSRMALLLYCTFLALFLPVYFFLPLIYGIRYYGFLWLVFACCFFIARPKLTKPALVTCYLLFLLQCVNGIYTCSIDWRYPFSEGRCVTRFLEQVKMSGEQVYVLNPVLRPAISAYSGEKYFGTENGRPLSYCLWGEKLPAPVLKGKLDSALNAAPSALIVTNRPFNGILDTTCLQHLASFRNGIFAGEDAEIYRYRRKHE
jgi:hypothetical protein